MWWGINVHVSTYTVISLEQYMILATFYLYLVKVNSLEKNSEKCYIFFISKSFNSLALEGVVLLM